MNAFCLFTDQNWSTYNISKLCWVCTPKISCFLSLIIFYSWKKYLLTLDLFFKSIMYSVYSLATHTVLFRAGYHSVNKHQVFENYWRIPITLFQLGGGEPPEHFLGHNLKKYSSEAVYIFWHFWKDILHRF